MLKNLNIMYLTDIPFSKLSCQITLDKFYRFSDGFIDQKDGKEDKRFMRNPCMICCDHIEADTI